MKKIIHFITLLAFALCLGSCVETLSMKDIGIKPKLVLYCFLSPQYDTISVSLSNSQPLFSSNRGIAAIKNAVVEISNNNLHWVQIPYDKNSQHYLLLQSQFPIIEGKTYYIRASAPDYESISASCTVPFWREIDLKPEVELVLTPRDYPYSAIDLSLSWKDYPNEENYYALMNYSFTDFSYDDYFNKSFQMDYLRGENYEVVISDEGKNGKKMKVFMESTSIASLSEFEDYCSQYDSVYIIFIQADKNAFLYENSADAAMGMDELSIFMLEPALIYNNIKDGYGIFGAMNFKSYRLNFRKKTIEEAEYPKKT